MALEPAEVDRAWARYGRGMLKLRVSGSVPESCWRASIRQSMIEVFPPQFEAVRYRTRTVCLQVVTPYVVEGNFELPTEPGDTIVLHHAGGRTDVPVEAGGMSGEPDPAAVYDEAEGRSIRRFSFEEALENAIANLPPSSEPIPDWLETVEVVGTYAQLGGIAGSRDLVVRVRRAQPPG